MFLYLDCRAEIHDVLEEYKEGAAKFMGKVQVFACISEIIQVDPTRACSGSTVSRKM